MLDIGGEFLARDIFRRPSQGFADASEEVDVVDSCGVLWVGHCDHAHNQNAIATRENRSREADARRPGVFLAWAEVQHFAFVAREQRYRVRLCSVPEARDQAAVVRTSREPGPSQWVLLRSPNRRRLVVIEIAGACG